MATKEEHWCNGSVLENHAFTRCARNATVLEDGKWWCWQHAPSRVKADGEKQRQRWAKEREAANVLRRTKREALEAQRRAVRELDILTDKLRAYVVTVPDPAVAATVARLMLEAREEAKAND